MTCFDDPQHWTAEESLALLNTAFELPLETMCDSDLVRLGRCALAWAESENYETKIAAWRAMHWLTFLRPQLVVSERIADLLEA